MKEWNEKADKELLDFLQFHLEHQISNWAVDATEDLFDEDNNETCRSFWFSVGPCQTVIVIAPTWEIKFFKPLKTHKAINKYDLLTQVSIVIIELLNQCYVEAAAETAAVKN